ncbi:hypothetical protein TNCV_100291 [Trichonephila clavipes]|nr:hypothetical protein TNCV_100291 [Trichonephila clavipes]
MDRVEKELKDFGINRWKNIVSNRSRWLYLLHGGTLSSRQAASPLVRLMEGEERWEAPDHSQGVLPQNWGRIQPNGTVTCFVL